MKKSYMDAAVKRFAATRKTSGKCAAPPFVQATEVDHQRALRALLTCLPRVPVDAQGWIDYQAAPPSVLAEIEQHANTSVDAIHLGLAAVGNLIPYAAPEIEDGTVSSDTVEALGWLIAELSDLAAGCTVLAAKCRRALGR